MNGFDIAMRKFNGYEMLILYLISIGWKQKQISDHMEKNYSSFKADVFRMHNKIRSKK